MFLLLFGTVHRKLKNVSINLHLFESDISRKAEYTLIRNFCLAIVVECVDIFECWVKSGGNTGDFERSPACFELLSLSYIVKYLSELKIFRTQFVGKHETHVFISLWFSV